MTRRITAAFGTVLMIVATIALYLGTIGPDQSATAGPQVVQDASQADYRLIVQNGDRTQRIIYVDSGVHTMAGANTPVVSSADCGHSGLLHMAEVRLVGTMTGTAPTLAFKWQNSIDKGVTWTDVGTFTTVNATVTPAAQQQKVSDLAASTAQVFGDCWRFVYTFGGTGTVSANFSANGFDK